MQSLRKIIPLHILFLFFSFSSVVAKYASFESLLSTKFILLYGISLAILFVYSILWQLVLRKYPLSTIYAHRSIVTIWGLAWGILLFGESIGFAKIIAMLLIVTGIIVIGKEDE